MRCSGLILQEGLISGAGGSSEPRRWTYVDGQLILDRVELDSFTINVLSATKMI